MKKVVILLVFMMSLYSCQKDNSDVKIAPTLKVKVMSNSVPCANAALICVFSEEREMLIKCDDKGEAIIKNPKIEMLVAVAPSLSAIIEKPSGPYLEISLEPVSLLKDRKSIFSEGTFGVYDTDSNGDVRFRYQGAFQYYYCINNLPSIPPNSPNPNNWDGWALTDFLPWNGKKLLVPRTYQWYHSAVYGYSISDALMLVSEL